MSGKLPAYVLGCWPGGLTIVRSLGRLGVPVVLAHHDAHDPGLQSRYSRAQLLPKIELEESAWRDWLLAEGAARAPQRSVLLPSSESMWLFIAKYRAQLEPYFRFALPEAEGLTVWPTKTFQYMQAQQLGIPTPRSWHPTSVEEVKALAPHLTYPCLIKPDLSHLWWSREGLTGKLACVGTPRELLDTWANVSARRLTLMIQEYIPGGEDQIYTIDAYFNRNSQPLAWYVTRKLRQYPPRFGNGTVIVSTQQAEVEELGLRLMRGLRWHGIGSVEFKRDARTGRFALMEMNLRVPSLVATGIAGGIDIVRTAYHELCGETVTLPRRYRVGRKVCVLENDYRAWRTYRRAGMMTVRQWLMPLLTSTRDVYFAWDDLRPFWAYLRKFIWRLRHERYQVSPEHLTVARLCADADDAGALQSYLGETVHV